MDKNENRQPFKDEVGTAGKDAFAFQETQTPKIVGATNTAGATEKTMSPTSPTFRTTYDEMNSPDQNLHDKYVDVNAIETTPRSMKQ
jgi:hypothetical protein